MPAVSARGAVAAARPKAAGRKLAVASRALPSAPAADQQASQHSDEAIVPPCVALGEALMGGDCSTVVSAKSKCVHPSRGKKDLCKDCPRR
mmetsp:Transcript_1744/g.6083  ORF Transcript_1744/g.6083 Transcript_1744/m.6083 type:complete len:91 (+) Transcript_1744:36-308(+)